MSLFSMHPAADITLTPEELTFTSNMTSHTVTVMAVADGEGEGDETAMINLTTNAVNVALSPDSATVTILDRDSEY